MKKWYVYELINTMGTVEYVGESTNPEQRFNTHTKRKSVLKKDGKPNGFGKFYKRIDIFMNIVKEFDNKTDAWFFQCKLQKEWGLKSDSETNSESRKGNQHAKGNIISDRHRKIISETNKGKALSNNHRLKISESKKGSKHSEETKQKIKDSWAKRKQNSAFSKT